MTLPECDIGAGVRGRERAGGRAQAKALAQLLYENEVDYEGILLLTDRQVGTPSPPSSYYSPYHSPYCTDVSDVAPSSPSRFKCLTAIQCTSYLCPSAHSPTGPTRARGEGAAARDGRHQARGAQQDSQRDPGGPPAAGHGRARAGRRRRAPRHGGPPRVRDQWRRRGGAPPSPSRTKWTRLVHPSVLIGHVSSLLAPMRM